MSNKRLKMNTSFKEQKSHASMASNTQVKKNSSNAMFRDLSQIETRGSRARSFYMDMETLDESLNHFQRQFEFGDSAVETVLQKRSFCASFVVIVCALIGAFMLSFFIGLCIKSRFDSVNLLERKTAVEEFEEIGKEILPDIEGFFYSGQSTISALLASRSAPELNGNESISTCVEDAYKVFEDFIFNNVNMRTFNNRTNPEIMKRITKMSTLDTFPPVMELLKPYFLDPKPFDQLIADSMRCSKENRYLVLLACEVMKDPTLYASKHFGIPSEAESLNFQLHFAVFLEVVTSEAVADANFKKGVYRHLINEAWDKSIAKIDENLPPNYREFFKQKVNSVFHVLESVLQSRSFEFDPRSVKKSLWINILEAAYVDLTDGEFIENTVTALILNYNLNELFQVEQDGSTIYSVGKEWADLYISWNLAYVERFQRYFFLYKLLIPSVLCTGDQGDHAGEFLSARATSLAVTLVVSLLGTEEDHKLFFTPTHQRPDSLMQLHGEININRNTFSFPLKDNRILQEMFIELCPGCHQGSNSFNILGTLSEKEYDMFVQLVLFVTVFITGLGLEIQLGPRIVDFFSSSNLAWLWILAQYLFSFFTIIAILSRSVFGLPFLVLGLWKGGFPETVAYVQKCSRNFRAGDFGMLFANFADSLGLLLHHGSSAYTVSAISIGHYQLTRELGSVLLPLVIQHWFVVVKYYSGTAYFVLQAVLEIWWELEFFSVYYHFVDFKDELYDDLGPAVALSMLFAHWLYIMSAISRAFIGNMREGNLCSYLPDLTQTRGKSKHPKQEEKAVGSEHKSTASEHYI